MSPTAEYDRLFIDTQSPEVYRSMSAVPPLAITMNAFNRVSSISGHPVRPRPA